MNPFNRETLCLEEMASSAYGSPTPAPSLPGSLPSVLHMTSQLSQASCPHCRGPQCVTLSCLHAFAFKAPQAACRSSPPVLGCLLPGFSTLRYPVTWSMTFPLCLHSFHVCYFTCAALICAIHVDLRTESKLHGVHADHWVLKVDPKGCQSYFNFSS